MGLLNTLLNRRPKIPEGASYWIDSYPGQYGSYCFVIRLALKNQPKDSHCKKVGPTFTKQVEADRYRDWLGGGAPYVYPIGAV